jgi:hypothetical protein
MKHNYARKVLELFAQGKITPGQLTTLEVAHDGWCGLHQGGFCDCNPEIRLLPLTGVKS